MAGSVMFPLRGPEGYRVFGTTCRAFERHGHLAGSEYSPFAVALAYFYKVPGIQEPRRA